MASEDRDFLLHRLDESRSRLEELILRVDKNTEIYTGWTMKHLLAHMTGWDDATIDSLRCHILGRPPTTPAIRSLDEYNTSTVDSRKDLDYEQTLKEWRLTRQVLRAVIEDMPEEKFFSPLIVPWGGKATVTFLVEMFRDHEEEHANDVEEVIKNPEKTQPKVAK